MIKVYVTKIHNVYYTTVINNTTINRVSYNGGNGGISARPTPQQESVAHERHIPPVAAQTQHEQAARTNPEQRAALNHGTPAVAATPKPGAFRDQAVVHAKTTGTPYNAPVNRAAVQPPANTPAAHPENNAARTDRPEPKNPPESNRAPSARPNQPEPIKPEPNKPEPNRPPAAQPDRQPEPNRAPAAQPSNRPEPNRNEPEPRPQTPPSSERSQPQHNPPPSEPRSAEQQSQHPQSAPNKPAEKKSQEENPKQNEKPQ